MEKIKVVLFSGGRGASAISRSIAKRPEFELTVVVNAYDDGLSTGLIRRLIPGMLGPSDIRKTVSNLLSVQDDHGRQLAELLESRIQSPSRSTHSSDDTHHWLLTKTLPVFTEHLTKRCADRLTDWVEETLEFIGSLESGAPIGWLDDMSLGNLVFAGAYLSSGHNFNAAIAAFSHALGLKCATILNVTEGECRVLVGIKEDGTFLPDEASIVDPQSDSPIARVFLLDSYLNHDVLQSIGDLDLDEKVRLLASRESIPNLNRDAKEKIEDADIIVYGPGTQHSSLFPTYLTRGLADSIVLRDDVERVFVGNLNADYDIQSENIPSLLRKVENYLNSASEVSRDISAYVTRCFLSTPTVGYTSWGFSNLNLGNSEVSAHIGQWTADGRIHDGDRVADGLFSLTRRRATSDTTGIYQTVSIVIPVLNEVDRLPRVMDKLLRFDWLAKRILPEIVVVDGGSTDGSKRIVDSFPVATLVELPIGTGRGEAITAGISASTGDLIVVFPSDDEYEVEAISSVAHSLWFTGAPIVFGSRVGLCADTDMRLREVYGGRTSAYLTSKWGGFALSLLAGVLWRRWIADVLTSVKGFSREAVEQLSLSGRSADWDAMLIVDAARRSFPIAEIPVAFSPRSASEGKKIKKIDGIRALKTLVVNRMSG